VTLTPPLSEVLAGASRAVARVLGGASLTAALDDGGRGPSRPAVQDLAYATLRDYGPPQAILAALARKGIPDRAVHALLLCALHELRHERRAPHTAVDEAVTASTKLGHGAARGFVNACLRNYLRRREALEADARRSEPGRFGYPQWWIDHVRRARPGWEAILAAGNARPPMTLRVNRRRLSVDAYVGRLAAAGLSAANLAADGFTGASRILEGERGMAAGMSSDADPARLTDRLGSRWATAETSFKFHAA